MKKAFLLLVTALLAGVLPAAARVHELRTQDFSRLAVVDGINVEYRCNADSAGYVLVDCAEDVSRKILLSFNKKNQLRVQLDPDLIGSLGLPTVVVYSSTLHEAILSSDSTLHITGLPAGLQEFKATLSNNGRLQVDGLDVDILALRILTGAGTISASGRCQRLNMRLLGSGSILAGQVQSREAYCRIMGTGTIECRVDGGELNVKGSGTGKVLYHGTPAAVKVKKLGTIRAIPVK